MTDVGEWMARLQGGEVRALARVISSRDAGEAIGEALRAACREVVFGGGGGALRVGKSTRPLEAADVFVSKKADRPKAVEAGIVAMQASAVPEVAAAGGRQAEAEGVLRIDHLGIAVRSLAAVRGFYEGLGLTAGEVETVESEGVRVMMLPVGESRVELLEAMGEETTIGRFLAKRGEGLHHVALRVGDLDELFWRLKGQGVRLASDAMKVGAGGHRYFFVHPESTGGVLVEMVG